MRKYFDRLKRKYDIKSDLQLIIINVVFALSGSVTLFARRGIFDILGIQEHTAFGIKTMAYIGTVVPSYFVILLLTGTIFGQFKFFWAFEKKMIRRFFPNRL